MLLDVRTYRCKPGTINAHLELYEKMGKPPQFRCLGEPLAYLKTETGDPNEYVHIWVYENAGDREAKRAARQQLPTATAAYIDRKIPYYELLSDEALEIIENNAERALEDFGIEFRHADLSEASFGSVRAIARLIAARRAA